MHRTLTGALALLLLAGCSPALNWRTVPLPEAELERLAELVFGRLHDNAALAAMRDALALADAANRWEALATETVALAGGAAA